MYVQKAMFVGFTEQALINEMRYLEDRIFRMITSSVMRQSMDDFKTIEYCGCLIHEIEDELMIRM